MTDIPIIDTHLHIWDLSNLSCPWLSEVPDINRTFSIADYQAATEGLPIEKMVFVQCEAEESRQNEEAEWVTRQAEVDPRISGIVAWAPLEKGDAVRGQLASLSEMPLVRGIRRLIQSESDPSFCLQADFVRGVQLLSEFGLSFDLCIKGNEQFKSTIALVRQCPDVRFILDHFGKPSVKEGEFDAWAGNIRELACLDNVSCKVSGLTTEADLERWTLAELRPYIDHAIEHFGIDRVMFGGDWPVCTLASTYKRWVETLSEAVAALTVEERRKLFCANAESIYRI